MKTINIISQICIAVLCSKSFGQSLSERLTLGKEYAEKELKLALSNTIEHNVVDSRSAIIRDSLTSISVAEVILFGIYGRDNIIEQRPYEVYHIDNYWVLNGTLPKGYKGGTFLIIIDDRNSKVIEITHGK